MNKAVLEDVEVLFLWEMLCAGVDNDLMNVLLERLVKSYVALRGHAFRCPMDRANEAETEEVASEN